MRKANEGLSDILDFFPRQMQITHLILFFQPTTPAEIRLIVYS